MSRTSRPGAAVWYLAAGAILCLSGCTSIRDYVHNGFKVGPNYSQPPAPVAKHWIDDKDVRIRKCPDDLSHWWRVFKDPALDRMVACTYQQNLSLKQAAFQVLQARYQLAIDQGNLFPQTQTVTGSYTRSQSSLNPPNQFVFGPPVLSRWNLGFNLQWELDFWGALRRAIIADEDTLAASVFNFDDVMVTQLSDVATYYVQMRTAQKQIEVTQANVELQRRALDYMEKRFKAGFHVSELDLSQTRGTLAQTEALIPPLKISLRQASDLLSITMGMPPCDLEKQLGPGPIPTVPTTAAIGIPADLLRRRPDVRKAERTAAAQAEQIGIAQAQLYPMFTINGNLGYSAQTLGALFTPAAFNGAIGPAFTWNVLNYGRIVNNQRKQDALFLQLVAAYQQTVLTANQEVEDALVQFLQSQEQAKELAESVSANQNAVRLAVLQLEVGSIDINRYVTIATALVQVQNTQAQAQGQIVLGLINVYKAMGGGWEIRCQSQGGPGAIANGATPENPGAEVVPTPVPKAPEPPAAPAAAAPAPPKATKSAAATDKTTPDWAAKKTKSVEVTDGD
jgi:NodT family efflux transporter outer membrane factor (OMF) lipoprotein